MCTLWVGSVLAKLSFAARVMQGRRILTDQVLEGRGGIGRVKEAQRLAELHKEELKRLQTRYNSIAELAKNKMLSFKIIEPQRCPSGV